MVKEHFVIYGFVDSGERDVVRYVGETKNIKRRTPAHRSVVNTTWSGYWQWAVKFFGRSVQTVVLEEFDGTASHAIEREAWHIREQQRLHERLTNGSAFRDIVLINGMSAQAENLRCALDVIRCMSRPLAFAKTRRSGLVNIGRLVDNLQTAHDCLRVCLDRDSFRNRMHAMAAAREAKTGLVGL